MKRGADSKEFFGALQLLAFLTLGALLALPAMGQVGGATVTGTVVDTSGAVIPNTQISIKNVATGAVRTVTSNKDGFYTAPNLLPGNYEVTASCAGFSTVVHSGITLTVGGQQVLNITMQVGQLAQQVKVTSEQPNVQLATSAIGGVVDRAAIVDLPLNGRDWTQLATLQPGVISVGSVQAAPSSYDRAGRGYGVEFSVSGSRPVFNNYRIDGISVNDYANAGPGSVEGATLGVDAIQEFSVLTSNYSAEYGRTSGGVVNAITRSGTNLFHGDAFEFLRNSALDGRNYFDPTKIPEFRRNQFGGSIGGPIRKDRTFFFVDYEGLRQNQGVSNLLTVPSPDARNGIIHNPDGTTTIVTVDPAVEPFLSLWGPVNDGLFPSGNTGRFLFGTPQITSENFVTGRIDQRFSDKDSMFGSYEYDPAAVTLPDSSDLVLVGHDTGRQFAAIEETHIFSPELLNTARFGYNRSSTKTSGVSAINPAAADPTLGITAGQNNPQISVSGLGTLLPGLNVEQVEDYTSNSFQEYDDVFLTKGIHSFKIGVSFEQLQLNDVQDSARHGTYSFGSLTNFLENRPRSLRADLPGQLVRPFNYRTNIFGTYLQDDIRLRPNLTINVGLRYEFTNGINEKTGRLSAVYNPADPTIHVQSPLFNNNTLGNFDPRIGFAWDPFRDGKTSVRGGFGIFDVLPLPSMIFTFATSNAPFFGSGTISNLSQGDFPTGAFVKLANLTNPPLQVPYVQQNPKRSYVQQWNLNLQREVLPGLTAMVAYVGSHGVHLPFRSDNSNTVIPTLTSAGYLFPDPVGSGTKIGPLYGRMPLVEWTNFSNYNALEFQVTKKMSHGFQVQGSYTWSRAIDEGDGTGPADPYLSSIADLFYFAPQYGKGPSDFNVTQNLTINYIWNIPAPASGSLPGPVAWAAHGWQLDGIFTARTGLPFTPLIGGDPLGTNAGTDALAYPERLRGSGCQSLINSGSVSNYINLNCFTLPSATSAIAAQCQPFGIQDGEAPVPGTCANLLGNGGRNEIYGPKFWNFDASLIKNNQIREHLTLQFRAEFFNIFNHSTFQSPIDNATLFNEDGSAVGGAGTIDATAHANREIQFGLKLFW